MARILVVENEPNVQLLLRLLLEEQGHEVIATYDGYLAVELYVERSVSLVICNLLNPTRNGLQTIQAIKSINKLTPAVVLSGSNIIQEPEYSEAARRIGVHATFAKPFDIGEFKKCIWEILGGFYGKRPCEENSVYSLGSEVPSSRGRKVPGRHPFQRGGSTSILPTFMEGYDKSIAQVAYDAKASAEALKKAGLTSVHVITYTNPRPYNSANGQALAEAIQGYLSKAGVTATIDSYDWTTYKQKVKAGDYDIAFYGWIGDNGDPDNFMYLLAHEDQTMNIALYKNAEFNKFVLVNLIVDVIYAFLDPRIKYSKKEG